MEELTKSICPVCERPSTLFITSLGRWHHHQECACNEVRIHEKLTDWSAGPKIRALSQEMRQSLSQQAREIPSHQYLSISMVKNAAAENNVEVVGRVARRRRSDPDSPNQLSIQ